MKLIQIPFDVLVGIAVYYVFASMFEMTGHAPVIIALVATAIFAEVFEIVWKGYVPRKTRDTKN